MTRARVPLPTLLRSLLPLLAGSASALSQAAWASDLYAIVANPTGAREAQAYIEVSGDSLDHSTGAEVLFSVFDADGVQITDFALRMNAKRYVSSASAPPPNDNFFALAAGGPALVRARLPSGGQGDQAGLRQTLGHAHTVVGIPPAFHADASLAAAGLFFPITLGEFSRAILLVGNVSGTDATVEVFVGTRGPEGTGKYGIARLKSNAVGTIEIDDPNDAREHLVLSSSGYVIGKLLVVGTTGALTESALVPFP